jgi:hypothetical protein
MEQFSAEDHGARPRILVVSRRHMRKNKMVDIVGEYQWVLELNQGDALPRPCRFLHC